MPDAPLLSIIVVTWNCRDLALRCLDEIAASRIGAPYEVLVVDNASADGTAAAVAAAHPAVRLTVNAENLGYARANNQAIAEAAGAFLLLLNPDAFPTGADEFAAMLSFLRAHGEYAALGCQLVHPDGRHQVGDAGFRPTPRHVAAHGLGLTRLMPGARGLFVTRLPDAVMDVDWVCGACLLVRAEVVRQVGGLDDRFFLYAEDVEWGCRMRARGHRIGYLPGVRMLHIQGGTQAGASPRWLDSLGQLYARMNGGRRWGVFRWSLAAGFAMRAAAYRAASLLPGRDSLAARGRVMGLYARHVWA
ncbi:MAG TPA: glycosyltransferase family 2 protein, partial [Acetobacteraceae bacterium]